MEDSWNQFGVYGIIAVTIDPKTQGVYVGETVRPFPNSWAEHVSLLQGGNHKHRDLQSAYNYGLNLVFIPLHIASLGQNTSEEKKAYVQRKAQAIWDYFDDKFDYTDHYMMYPMPYDSILSLQRYFAKQGIVREDLAKQLKSLLGTKVEAPKIDFQKFQREAGRIMHAARHQIATDENHNPPHNPLDELAFKYGGFALGQKWRQSYELKEILAIPVGHCHTGCTDQENCCDELLKLMTYKKVQGV